MCIYDFFYDLFGPYFILWLFYEYFMIFRFFLEILMKSKAKPRKIMKHDEPPLHKFSQKQQISKKKMKKKHK